MVSPSMTLAGPVRQSVRRLNVKMDETSAAAEWHKADTARSLSYGRPLAKTRPLPSDGGPHWAWRNDGAWTFVTGGGSHLPVSASLFGAYRRMVRLKGPVGAGSQFASLSAPGLSCWK